MRPIKFRKDLVPGEGYGQPGKKVTLLRNGEMERLWRKHAKAGTVFKNYSQIDGLVMLRGSMFSWSKDMFDYEVKLELK